MNDFADPDQTGLLTNRGSPGAGTIDLAPRFEVVTERLAMMRALKPLGYAVAAIYFVADLLFETVALPLSTWIGRLKILQPLYAWIASLRPYPALALFTVPVVILEPVKPVGAFLVSTGHVAEGTLTIAAGEILKITLVERLFRLTRDRLMQIPAFAMLYRHWIRFHDWLSSSEIWRWLHGQIMRLKSICARGMASALPRPIRRRWLARRGRSGRSVV